jgi:hypothetical protein
MAILFRNIAQNVFRLQVEKTAVNLRPSARPAAFFAGFVSPRMGCLADELARGHGYPE